MVSLSITSPENRLELIERTSQPRPLPRWPLTAAILGYPAWWLLGLGDIMFPVLAGVMAFELLRTRRLRLLVPRGFGIWLAFMAMMTLSVFAVDTFGRLVGFGFRWMLYASATVIFLYVYHARTTINARYVAGLGTGFLAIMTVGGILGMLSPVFTLTTPLAHVLPGFLLNNDLVQEMVVRRLTQYNPEAWAAGTPRPSAPFLYTNGWGFAYAVVLPVALAYASITRGQRRFWWVVATIAASLAPAIYTQNRGLYIGLGVALIFTVGHLAWKGRVRLAGAFVGLAVAGIAAFWATGAFALMANRLETTESTSSRATLYAQTFQATLLSPIIGYGAPRPADNPALPSMGTQGQIWLVMFSHGLPALVLFMAWFAMALYRARPGRSPLHLAFTAAILTSAVLCSFYNIINATVMIVMMFAAIAVRPEVQAPTGGRHSA